MNPVLEEHTLEEYRAKISSLSQPQTTSEWKNFNKLQPLSTLISELDTVIRKQKEAEGMISSESDSSLIELAKEEVQQMKQKTDSLNSRILEEIENLENTAANIDDRNAILEIRAGTGGEEASLFASDLFRMYSHYAQNKDLSIEILNQHLSGTGGIKEVSVLIAGPDAYGRLKSESGVHRVQRVPATENAGRIHTSTASVAVIPEAEDIDVVINPEDITLETFRASGAGGQHINKTDSAVRITHHATGIVVSCQENRSQIKNRKSAMSLLRSRLYDHMLQEQQNSIASLRRSQIGSGKRSEKIRTYNFPQDRVTDHRMKKSWHNIEAIMNGDLDEILSPRPVNL